LTVPIELTNVNPNIRSGIEREKTFLSRPSVWPRLVKW
jgi:hypothetical protein